MPSIFNWCSRFLLPLGVCWSAGPRLHWLLFSVVLHLSPRQSPQLELADSASPLASNPQGWFLLRLMLGAGIIGACCWALQFPLCSPHWASAPDLLCNFDLCLLGSMSMIGLCFWESWWLSFVKSAVHFLTLSNFSRAESVSLGCGQPFLFSSLCFLLLDYILQCLALDPV